MNQQASDNTITLQSDTLDDTIAIGQAIGQHAIDLDIIALVGDLGAGKTQFVRGLATGMNLYPHAVSSPTFVIMHEYDTEEGAPLVLVHIDAYRLETKDDLASIGWTGDGHDFRSGAVVAIEWANLIDWALDEHTLLVDIAHQDPGRKITFTPGKHWAKRLQEISFPNQTLTP
ncbi:tRNA (adenosine(37)-N6)-threonylcarbamoyltransferase complex ATPase subunit type 1 TsaE [Poriferisphaera corsica]|uniref:tRNA (adenosine(37)-N6)-threonylcarbamoyltransferase complex ATPase subunit type 1 TsaE n=1 Tax=Poriferisphaera corsica TaxID=2528020 RepID=UPI00190A3AD6|nr:tRNA (adenosine(37)-N6)-threonylcarbamoyltransferase complex ATPase subunit type 1 TsaE [Poriferisphaera corsica]